MGNLAILTTLGFVLSTATAWGDTMDATFGNTVTITQPNGMVDRYFFEPDGAFTERAGNGQTHNGRWVRRAGEVCLSLADRAQPDCANIPTDKGVGDTWRLDVDGGGTLAIAIVAGRS